MKLVPITTLALLGMLTPAHGDFSINFGASKLRDALGIDLDPGDLVVITASTLDTFFAAPTATAFVSGDDIEIARFGVDPAGDLTAGPSFTLLGDWNVGDPLQMYWFPSLTTSSLVPGLGTAYGQFRTSDILDGSDIAWITPADGITATLNFLTLDGGGTTHANEVGNASLTVTAVPEPAAIGQVAGLLMLCAGVWRRVISTRNSSPRTRTL